MAATATLDKQREELMTVLGQLEKVGSVELKMNVPPEQRAALRNLQLDPLLGKIREITFYDTADLKLFSAGVVIRSRRTQGADVDDTVVKLRPAPNDLPAAVRNSPNLKVEMDVTRSGYVVSASLKGTRPAGTATETLRGRRTVEKLLTKEQRGFFADHMPEGVSNADLVPLGPTYVIVLKQTPADFAHRLTIEQWHFPGQLPLVEMSTKAPPNKVFQVASEAREYLGRHGLEATGEQEPKTRKALEYFTRGAST